MHDTYSYQPNGDLYARDCNGRTYRYEHFYSYDANNRLRTYNRDDLVYLTYNNTTGSLTSIPGVSDIYSSDDKFAPSGMKLQDNRYGTCEHHIEYNAQNLPVHIEQTTSDTIPLFERYYFHDDYELHNWRGTMKEILYLGGNAYTAPIFLVRYPNERCHVSEEDVTGYTCLWQVGVIGRDLQQNIRSVIIDDSYMAQSTYLSEWGYLEYANLDQ